MQINETSPSLKISKPSLFTKIGKSFSSTPAKIFYWSVAGASLFFGVSKIPDVLQKNRYENLEWRLQLAYSEQQLKIEESTIGSLVKLMDQYGFTPNEMRHLSLIKQYSSDSTYLTSYFKEHGIKNGFENMQAYFKEQKAIDEEMVIKNLNEYRDTLASSAKFNFTIQAIATRINSRMPCREGENLHKMNQRLSTVAGILHLSKVVGSEADLQSILGKLKDYANSN